MAVFESVVRDERSVRQKREGRSKKSKTTASSVTATNFWQFEQSTALSLIATLLPTMNSINVRSVFVYDKIINWFPGHMAKGLRLITEKLNTVQVVIEVRDARISTLCCQPCCCLRCFLLLFMSDPDVDVMLPST
jgi:hypothetical protein